MVSIIIMAAIEYAYFFNALHSSDVGNDKILEMDLLMSESLVLYHEKNRFNKATCNCCYFTDRNP